MFEYFQTRYSTITEKTRTFISTDIENSSSWRADMQMENK